MTTIGKRIKDRHDGLITNIQVVGSRKPSAIERFVGLNYLPEYANVSPRKRGGRRASRR